MKFIKNLTASNKPPKNEHAVIIKFNYGLPDSEKFYELVDDLIAALNNPEIGYYDGHEIADDNTDGFYFMYGNDAHAIYDIIKPILCKYEFIKGANIRLRFGDIKNNPEVKEFVFE